MLDEKRYNVMNGRLSVYSRKIQGLIPVSEAAGLENAVVFEGATNWNISYSSWTKDGWSDGKDDDSWMKDGWSDGKDNDSWVKDGWADGKDNDSWVKDGWTNSGDHWLKDGWADSK